MVDLGVVQARRAAVFEDGEVLAAAVADSGEVLDEVDGGVGVVADAEEEDLARELPDAADGAVGAVRDVDRVGRGDAGGGRAGGGESVRAVAAEDAGEAPEGVGDDAHAAAGSGLRVEGMVVVIRHAGHDERAVRGEGFAESVYEAFGAAFDGPDGAVGRVDEEDGAALHAESEQLFD